MKPEIILKTERCYLREILVSDLPERILLYSGPHMTDFIEPLYEPDAENEYQRRYIEEIYGKYGYGMWAVFDRTTDRLIGEAGLEHRMDTNRERFPYDWMFEETCDELGFCIAEDLWGRGYCTEVCRAVLRYGIETLGHDRFFARADERNAASVRVLEKLGFSRYEGNYYILDKGRMTYA
ncbi:MAG: GNAT family N-acetyltransferase [Lachnospiraceae bacterium]|nr:GNAT family N-acetyltransferase [Lachnospiraceae bacterium]